MGFAAPDKRPFNVVAQGCLLCKSGSLCEICALKHVSVRTYSNAITLVSWKNLSCKRWGVSAPNKLEESGAAEGLT